MNGMKWTEHYSAEQICHFSKKNVHV